MEEILEKAKLRAEEAEVYTVISENTPIQFETNRLKHAQTHQSTTVALRVVKQGRLGYATASGQNGIDNIVDAAIETAQFGTECKFQFPASSQYPVIQIDDPDVMSVPVDRMVKMGDDMISDIRKNWPDLVCQAWLSRGVVTVNIENTRGCRAKYRQTHFSVSISGTLIRGTDMLFVGDGESSCHPVLDTRSILATVHKQMEWSHDQASISTGSYPVLFTPSGAASALISPFMVAFNGKTVFEGASPVGDSIGKTVLSPEISIYDDPTQPFRPSSRPCDDEAVPSARIPLIERGVVRNFLYDLQTAGLAGKRSTGSAGRGRGLPSPSPSAFVFTPGSTGFEDMLQDMKEGLVVEELMGAEQGNILGGDFSGNVLLGFKVEHGKIVGRVKNTMVSGNVYQLFKNVTVGSDARWLGGLYAPSFYFPGVSVASK
jgi:PmbA protein